MTTERTNPIKSAVRSWIGSCTRNKQVARNTIVTGLVILDHYSTDPILSRSRLVAPGGEIKGVRGSNVRRVLAKHGLPANFLKEVTTRSAHKDGERLADALRAIDKKAHAPEAIKQAATDLVAHANRWLARQHIKIYCDIGHSPSAWIQSILAQSRDRSGGKVEQHLVGAKLEERHPGISIANHPANAGDRQTGREGDFVVGSTAYHVTAAPGRDVIKRCEVNLAAGVHPVLLVPKTLVPQTILRAENEELGARITVIAIEDFLALNIIEMTAGDQLSFRAKLASIIERYNRRLREAETDQSLSIDLA